MHYKLPSRTRKPKEIPQPQLIPVLDAMFIMIFFILATATFTKPLEIGSDLPVMRISQNENPDKRKFSLRMQINTEKVTLTNDIDKKELFSGIWKDPDMLKQLNAKCQELKSQFVDDNRVVVVSDLSSKYEDVVLALDAVRQVKVGKEVSKLFNQIMFETE
ncbi:MAG: biopolymer transporter ExbD [Bacteriovoracaceae bacterium]|nr:biopolymer transporter ExbD [Bacteriovoracaceae bacterium]